MTTKRLQKITEIALAALSAMRRYGSVKMNRLAKITVAEAHELNKTHRTILPFTRIFDYEDSDYKEDSNRMASSQLPTVREIWVGCRSLSAVGEDEDLTDGMSASALDQEDSAELTELQTMTYNDKPGFDRWYMHQLMLGPEKRGCTMAELKSRLPKDKDGDIVPCMFNDPETGEYRPVMIGDVIQVAWGSNEDLDALYLEEPADPRSESDHILRELTRDQIRANTYLEEQMMPSALPYSIPRERLPEGLTHDTDDLYRWRVAHLMTERYLESCERDGIQPSGNYRELADMAFRRLEAREKNVRFVDGKLVEGQFFSRRDYWDQVESNIRSLKELSRKKAAPKALPKDAFVRTPNDHCRIPAWAV